jgi:hypothetical protein
VRKGLRLMVAGADERQRRVSARWTSQSCALRKSDPFSASSFGVLAGITPARRAGAAREECDPDGLILGY